MLIFRERRKEPIPSIAENIKEVYNLHTETEI